MTIETTIYVIIGIVMVGLVSWWIYLEKTAKCKVRMKMLIKGRKIVKDFRAKEYTDKSNIPWWKLMGEKNKDRKLIPLPPEESIEIDSKGKKCIECYRFEDGTVSFVKDVWDVQTPKWLDESNMPADTKKLYDAETDNAKRKEIFIDWKKKEVESWEKQNHIISPKEPITTKQRALYLMNIKKAQERKGIDWKQQLLPIASIAAIVVVLVALMIFWGDIAAPALQADKITQDMQKTNLEMLQIVRDIKNNQQTIQTTLQTNQIAKNIT